MNLSDNKLGIKLDIGFVDTAQSLDKKLQVLIKQMQSRKIKIGVSQETITKEFEKIKQNYNNLMDQINNQSSTKNPIGKNLKMYTLMFEKIRQLEEKNLSQREQRWLKNLKMREIQEQKNAKKINQQRINEENKYEQWWLKNLKQRELREQQSQKSIQDAIGLTIKRRIEEQRKWDEAQQRAISKNLQAEQSRVSKLGAYGTNITSFGNEAAIKQQIKDFYGLNSSIISYSKGLDGAGNSQIKFKVATEQSNNQVKVQSGVIDRNTSSLYQQGEVLRVNANRMLGWVQGISTAIAKSIQWGLSMSLLYGHIRKLKEGIGTIVELDKSMRQVQMVQGVTKEKTDSLTIGYANMGIALGKTTKELASMSVSLARQGLDLQTSLDRMQTFTKLSSVLNKDVSEMTEKMTAGINSMKVNADELADVVTKVGSIAATSGDEILTVIQKSGSAARLGNISMQELASMAAVVSESTRESADTIGNSLKTIFSKFQQVNEIGEVNDEYGKVIKTLKNLGIAVENVTTGQLLPVSEILKTTGEDWNKYSENTQRAIATTLGIRQFNRFSSLMEGFSSSIGETSRYIEIYDEALNASGETNKQYVVYLDSVAAANNRAKASFEKMFINALNSDTIKMFYDLSASITQSIDKIGLLNTTVFALSNIILIANKSYRSFITSLIAYDSVTKTTTLNTGILSGAITSLKVSMDLAKISALAMQAALTLGLAVAITAIVSGISKWATNMAEAKRKQEELIQSTMAHAQGLEDEINKLETLNKKYKDLSEQKKQGLDVDDELLSVQQELASISNELITGIDKEGKSISDNIGLTDKLIAKKKELYNQEIEAVKFKASQELPSIRKQQQELEDELKEIHNKLKSGDTEKVITIRGTTSEIDISNELNVRRLEIVNTLKALTEEESKYLSILKKVVKQEDIVAIAEATSIKEMDYRIKKLKELGLNQEDINFLLVRYKNTLNSTNEAESKLTSSTLDMLSIQKSIQKVYSETYDDLNDIDDMLKEYAKSNEFSQEKVLKLAKAHPFLIATLNDEKKIEEELIKIKDKKLDTAQDSINKELELIENYLNQKVDGYEFDLKRYADAESAKLEYTKVITQKIMDEYSKLADKGEIYELQAEKFAMNAIKNAEITDIPQIEDYFNFKDFKVNIKTVLDSDDKKDKTKKLEEHISDLSDRYKHLEDTIDSLNDKLEINNQLQNQTENSNKIALLQEEIDIYEKLRDTIPKLADERRKEREEIVANMNALGNGFGISIDIVDDKSTVEGLENINKIEGSTVKETNKLRKEFEGLYGTLTDLDGQIKDSEIQMLDYETQIIATQKEIASFSKEYFETLAESQDKIDDLNFDIFKENTDTLVASLKPLSMEVSNLKTKLDLVSDSNFDDKLATSVDIVSTSRKNVRELKDEFDRLAKITPKNAQEAEYLASKMSDLSSQIKDSRLETKEYERSLENLKVESYLTAPFENSRKVIEKEISMIDSSLQMLERGITSSVDLDDALAFNFIPESEQDKLIRENEKIFDEYESHEKKIAKLREKANEEKVGELENFLAEEEEKQRKHLYAMTDELVKSYLEQNNVSSEQLNSIGVNTELGLTSLVDIYRNKWEEIVNIVEESARKIAKTSEVKIDSGSSEVSYKVPGYKKGGELDKDQLLAYGEEGRELVILPNGDKFLSPDKTSLAYLPQGTQIIPNHMTEQLLNKGLIQGYKNGTYDSLEEYLKAGVRPSEDEISNITSDEFKNHKRDGSGDTKGEARRDYIAYWEEVFGYIQSSNTSPKFTDDNYDSSSPNSNNSSSSASRSDFEKSFSGLKEEAYNVTPSKSFRDKYKSYERENEDYDDLINEMRDNINRNNPEEVQELLDKIDEQTMLNIDIYSDRKIDLNEQFTENLEDYIDALEDAYDEAEDGSELQLQLQEEILKANQDLQQAELNLHQAIKDKYEYQFKMMDKELGKSKDLQDDIQDQASLLDDEDYSKRLEFTDDLLKSEKEYNESLQDNISLLKDQMGELEVGSYEWNILNTQVEEYEELLEDSNISINDMAEKIAEIDFDKMISGLSDLNNEMNDLQYELDIQTTIDSSNIDKVNSIYQKMNENTEKEIEYLYTTLDQLKEKQSHLDENSAEWDVIANQIDEVNSKIREGNLELMERSKTIFSGFMGDIVDNIETGNPRPTDPSSSTEDENEYISGLEKELEIEKLRNFITKNSLTLSESQLAILNSTGKIKRDSLEMLQKELDLQQLQLKLDNLREQKTIQQLQQQDDGTWDFTYVADQDAIDETQEAILDKQIEIEKARKESEKQAQEDSYQSEVDSYERKMNELQEILDKAESRSYKSIEEFRDALESLGLDLPIDEMVQQYAKYFEETGNILIQDAVDSVTEILETKSEEFENAGNDMGKAYVDGLLGSIDTIMEGEGTLSEKQRQILDMLANEYTEFALVGNESGMALIQGLIDGMATDDYAMDFDEIALKIKDQLTSRASELESGGQDVASAFVNGLVVGIDEILSNGEIENKTQAILDLLNKADEYGTLGSALGSEFMDSMISVFENTAGEIEGEGDGAISQAINTIVEQLDAKIVEFAEKGDLQGVAYAEALRDKLTEALTNAELTQADIIALLNEYSDFDLAGLLSGEAYGDSLGLELDNAQGEAQNSTSAIVQGLQEDVASFAAAGQAQGEAYKSAILSAFNSAAASAKAIVANLTTSLSSMNPPATTTTTTTTKTSSAYSRRSNVASADSGGYLNFSGSGIDGKGGKLIVAHPNEVINNPVESAQLLEASRILKEIDLSSLNPIDITKNLISKISLPDFSLLKSSQSQTVDQKIEMNVTLPNVKDGKDFIDYIDSFPSDMMQLAYSKKG